MQRRPSTLEAASRWPRPLRQPGFRIRRPAMLARRAGPAEGEPLWRLAARDDGEKRGRLVGGGRGRPCRRAEIHTREKAKNPNPRQKNPPSQGESRPQEETGKRTLARTAPSCFRRQAPGAATTFLFHHDKAPAEGRDWAGAVLPLPNYFDTAWPGCGSGDPGMCSIS